MRERGVSASHAAARRKLSAAASNRCISRVEGEAGRKHRQAAQQRLLLSRKQCVTPIDCCAQGVVLRRKDTRLHRGEEAKRSLRRAATSWTVITFTLALANSSARGMPSSRQQISTSAPALLAVN